MMFFWFWYKYKSLFVCSAANPGLKYGGLIGESKQKIYNFIKADKEALLYSELLKETDDIDKKLAWINKAINKGNITFPFILKPDIAYKGRGVTKIANMKEAKAYLIAYGHRDIICQEY